MSYILLTTPLVLHADPILPSHAVTRQYVDNKRANLNASWFTTGTISAARMPALGGDVSSVAGSGTVSLNVNGVTAGTYTKVTVDATGRVTAGGTLVSGDIASISWTKITSGKPTTAAGYGVTNLISLSGGTVTGNVSSTATPSTALHAVTKGYVDNAISGVVSASLSTGDVLRKPLTIAPSGFLRCNGGDVSKTTYSALFTAVGDTFNTRVYTYTGGRPWVMQYDFNTQQPDSITGWVAEDSSARNASQAQNSQIFVTKNKVYFVNTGKVAPINTDGTIGAITSYTQQYSSAVTDGYVTVVIKDKFHTLCGNQSGGNYYAYMYAATVDNNGTLGTLIEQPSLNETKYFPQVFVTNKRVYLVGGLGSGFSESATVRSSPINTDGTLGPWATGVSFPVTIRNASVAVTKDRVYLIGGRQANVSSTNVYTSTINADGTIGTWATSGTIPIILDQSSCIVTNKNVYLLGGSGSGSGYRSEIYRAPINTDGTLGTWVQSGTIPNGTYGASCFITSSKIYLTGGLVSSGNSFMSASFSGGFNDYTDYVIGGNFLSSTTFMLPDFSSLEESNINYFIKT